MLEACCAEREQEALLLGGSRSLASITTELFPMLAQVLPASRTEIVAGLNHFTPDEKAPDVVAGRLAAWFVTWPA